MLEAVVSIATLIFPTDVSIILVMTNLLIKSIIENEEENMNNRKGVSCCEVGT